MLERPVIGLRPRCCFVALALAVASLAAMASAGPPGRVRDRLLAEYSFETQADIVIRDRLNQTDPVDLRIDKPHAALFRQERMEIVSEATIASDGPARRITAACRETNELSIEAWLHPRRRDQKGPARIVTLSLDSSKRNFTLGQDGDRFQVRLRTTSSDPNGLPGLESPTEAVTTNLTHCIFTRSADGQARIYLNGEEVAAGNLPGTFAKWDDNCRLSLGNEITGDRPWMGNLHLVALYSRALSAIEVQQNFAAGVPRAVDYAAVLPAAAIRSIDFVKDVQPIFRGHCYDCHSADNEDGELNLGIRQRAMLGGVNGPVISVGNSAESRLIHRVAAVEAKKAMPPDSEGLSDEQVGVLRAWIDQGAPWPDGTDIPDPRVEKAKSHWAFQPLRTVKTPEVNNAVWLRTPVDAFILSRLEQAGIKPAERVDPRRLIRRITFDLIGLPPSPQEVDAFCQAAGIDFDAATTALVERLLASSHYGERWGRHWLDVARYADSDGQESDRDRPFAYHYRDFVIRAFNRDMPFDQFVRWQLAGDEYEPENAEALAATGFIVAGPFAALPDRLMEDERLRNRYNELDDELSTIGTGLLGLTLGCARCHDHKYDAIPARDYYSLMSAFHGGDRAEIAMGQETYYAFQEQGRDPSPTWLFQRGNYYDRDQPVSLGFVSLMTNGKSPDQYWRDAKTQIGSARSSGQRRAVADWITDTDHGAGALLARVFVNRVWMHHFGQGIVRTPGDFGVRAEPPTHPELLEWLTHDFVTHGWQLKRLHRLILLSSTWQQSGGREPSPLDPDNRLLSRMPIQRLEGEILRDSMLAVSGVLNLTAFGPAVRPPIASEAIVARNLKSKYPEDIQDGPEVRRRSVYLFHKRVVPYPLLQAFDKPDAQQSCSRRDQTTVAPQALALLNDPFARTMATEFAQRIITRAGSSDSVCVDQGYRLALARFPSPEELTAGETFISRQISERLERQEMKDEEAARREAIADFCQVLFSLNEFLYVD